MKRKTLIALLAAVAAFAIGGFAFSACTKNLPSGNGTHNTNLAATDIYTAVPEAINESDNVNGCSHEYSKWTVGFEPTCTSIGYNVRTCAKCGDLDYQFLEAKGHSYKTVNYNQSIHIYECTTCYELVTAEHDFDENNTCTFCKYVADYTLGLYFYLTENQSYSVRAVNNKATIENLIIPSTYKGLPVTEIYTNGFINCKNLKSVVIPDNVKKISNNAFAMCPELAEITFPKMMTEIGNYAFFKCTGLKEITLPESLTKVGNSIFRGCTSLTKISIPDDWTTIPNNMYWGCTGLENIEIPDKIVEIGSYAFCGCSQIKSVKFNDNLTAIDSYAFSGCTALESIQLPENVTKISNFTFSGCTSLKSVIFNDNLTSICKNAFGGCSALESIELPESLQNIGENAFGGTAIKKIVLKDGATVFGGFGGCETLVEVVLPETITIICTGALTDCEALTRITFNGTMAEWKAVEKESGWKTADNIITDFFVDCTDGTLEYIW